MLKTTSPILVCAAFAIASLMTSRVSGEICYWKTDAEGGSGGWDDATRWVYGKVPQANDYAYVHGTAVVRTESDMTVVHRVGKVYTQGAGDILRFEVSGEQAIATHLDGHGKFVFAGGGDITLSVAGADSMQYYMREGMEVESGTVYLPSDSGSSHGLIIGPLTVNAPGTVCVGASGMVECGLRGDGTVTSPSASGANLRFVLGTEEDPYVFSGAITGKVQVELYGGCQYLTATDNANTGDFRFRKGTLGVSSLGSNGGTSSFGKSSVWVQNTGAENIACLRYLGNGESTTRSFNVNSTTPQNEIMFDGGPNGGLDLAGTISGGGSGAQTRVTFCGDGTNAVNKVSGSFNDPTDGSTHILKKGCGTWRFPAKNAAYHGVFAVEQGTLEYASMAAAGSVCSLGYANRLYERRSGSTASLSTVAWAYLLGDGVSSCESESLATFSYIGDDPVDCSTRPIAIKGAARLRNASSASFRYVGITSAQAGNNTLVLDGAGTDNSISVVSNGVGSMRIVKEGVGAWTIDGAASLAGGLCVKSGRLTLKNTDNYSWLRFSVTAVQNGGNACRIGHIGFYDAEGNELTTNLTYYADGAWWAAGAKPQYEPQPGQICYMDPSIYCNVNPTNAFGPYVQDSYKEYIRGDSAAISSEKPFTFLLRLPNGVARPVAYDMVTAWYNNSTTPYVKTMISWTVEGSVDGISWTPLAGETNWRKCSGSGNYWVSDGRVWSSDRNHQIASGFEVSTSFPIDGAPTSVGFVEVDAGGSLEVTGELTVNELGIDCASAVAGTFRNVKFAPVGVIRIRNLSDVYCRVSLACDDEAGLSNLEHWTAVDDRGRERGFAVDVSRKSLLFFKPGMRIVIR